MDPLIIDSVAEAALFFLGGGVISVGIYYFISTRLSVPERRQAQTLAQLESARARELKRQIQTGPAFPRLLPHLHRISTRAEEGLQHARRGEWSDPHAQQQCVEHLEHLVRHCQELERVLHPTTPRRRRGTPEP